MAIRRLAATLCVAILQGIAADVGAVHAQGTSSSQDVRATAPVMRKHATRPRLHITPRQPAAWDYPRPGTISWPGPNAVRECVSKLVQENRPSGTVITPQMRCRWIPG